MERAQFAKSMESKILREIEKEGGALGKENLKQFGEKSEIKRVLAEMEKKVRSSCIKMETFTLRT